MPAPSTPVHGGHDDAGHLAAESEQAIRRLTHLTRAATGEPDDPGEAADVIAALAAMTWMLPQLLGQIARRLHHQHQAGRLRIDAPAPSDPDQNMLTLTSDLQHAAQSARAAAEALDAAHQHAARLALTNPAAAPDRRGQHSCTQVGPNHLTRPRRAPTSPAPGPAPARCPGPASGCRGCAAPRGAGRTAPARRRARGLLSGSRRR